MSGGASPVRSILTRAGRNRGTGTGAPPIREVLNNQRAMLSSTRERSQSPFATVRHFAVTSPGKLVAICVALAVLSAGVGLYASSVLDKRTQTLQTMIDQTEPLAEGAQVLYSSLSIADASANAAFISGGLESPELRTRYADALATASTALITAAGTSGEPGEPQSVTEATIHDDLNTLSTAIPTYSGLIETARTNNRLNNPIGSAYLGQASALMHDEILPAAQRLYEMRSAAIADPQRAMTTPPWGVYACLTLLIIALLLTSRYLRIRTRRRFNIGVVAALLAVVLGSLWLLIAGLLSVAATSDAKTDGADPLRQLTEARILTQQARSAETLALLRRGDQSDLEQTYEESTTQIRAILTELKETESSSRSLSQEQLGAISEALSRWQETDANARERIELGDFAGARTLTVGTGPDSSAHSYGAADAALVDTITTTRTSFRDDINTAQRVLEFSTSGIVVLTLFASGAVIVGLVPRVREYR